MAVWYTADLHFGHANIVAYTGRPATTLDEMHETLIARFATCVGADDELIVLGDVALGVIDATLPLAARLPGRKTLIPGNHDRCWFGHGARATAWRQRYLDAGFDRVIDHPDPVDIDGVVVRRSHFPYRGSGDHSTPERFSEYRLTDDGGWLLCGHVHERWKQCGRMINVGVDAWAGRPVHIDELAALVRAGACDRAAEPWPHE